jgi:bifunctional DNA-binding transcriptional regulator/antitoxin component of YhaV-PrlF toxin-antitoxin module
MAFVRVQSRGQITLSRDVRARTGIKPGDRLLVVPDGLGRLKLEAPPTTSFSEMLDRFCVEGPIDRERAYDDLAREAFKSMAASETDVEPRIQCSTQARRAEWKYAGAGRGRRARAALAEHDRDLSGV